jgi:hypothetical protein
VSCDSVVMWYGANVSENHAAVIFRMEAALFWRSEREADHSLSFSSKIYNAWGYTPLAVYALMGILLRHRNKFTFSSCRPRFN